MAEANIGTNNGAAVDAINVIRTSAGLVHMQEAIQMLNYLMKYYSSVDTHCLV